MRVWLAHELITLEQLFLVDPVFVFAFLLLLPLLSLVVGGCQAPATAATSQNGGSLEGSSCCHFFLLL